MEDNPIYVNTHEDREVVAQNFEKYGFMDDKASVGFVPGELE